MGTVTRIRPKGRRSDRFVVEVDGAALATVDLELWSTFSLHVGDALADEAETRLVDAAGKLAARDRALAMLAAHGRSREMLRRRLVEKGIEPLHATHAVEALASAGLLDDGAFAKQYAHSRALAGHGPRRILADLARQGVRRELAAEAVQSALADSTVDADEAIRRLVARRVRSLERFDEATRQRRLAGFLARRGHGPTVIARLLREVRR